MTLEGGWVVGERLDPPGGTGGCFSVRYRVTGPGGQDAFLKALDISAILNQTSGDVAQALQTLTSNYLFERGLVAKCADASRVVHGLSSGQALVQNAPLSRVPYLIFEYAEGGDVRRYLSASLSSLVGIAWKLRTLHHIAVGLQQLHRRKIAHQDLKPSNVLVFAESRKIGDLGSASEKGNPGPRDDQAIAGDVNYPPIELFYGYTEDEWERRLGYDLYLLGSMAVFFFTQTTMNALLVRRLDPVYYPDSWAGTFVEVLPYLQFSFAESLTDFEAHIPVAELRPDLRTIVAELCNPDPKCRGNIAVIPSKGRFSLESYVSKFNRLAREAELKSARFREQ
jgi:serine/threonine protein kinase